MPVLSKNANLTFPATRILSASEQAIVFDNNLQLEIPTLTVETETVGKRGGIAVATTHLSCRLEIILGESSNNPIFKQQFYKHLRTFHRKTCTRTNLDINKLSR